MDDNADSIEKTDLLSLIRALEVLEDDTDTLRLAITPEEMILRRQRVLARLRTTRVEHDRPARLTAWMPRPTTTSRRRRVVTWLLATAAAIGCYGALTTLLASSGVVLIVLFALLPALLVFGWYFQARDEVTRQSALLDSRAQELRHLHQRILLVARMIVAQRRLCEEHGLESAASKLDFLGHQLRAARKSVRALVKLIAGGSENTRRFVDARQRDPYGACSDYAQPPLAIDPDRIGIEVDDLVRLLRLANDVAVDIPLYVGISGEGIAVRPDAAGEIAAELGEIFRDVRRSTRFLKAECRKTLLAFDALHRLTTTTLINQLTRDPASRAAARTALALSALPRPLAHKPAVRTAFLREVPTSGDRSWVWIPKATTAALTQSQKSA